MSKFWLVWRDGTAPQFRHLSKSAAEAEAKRLAKYDQAKEYFVLEALSVSKLVEPVQTTQLVEEDCPF